MVSLLGSQVGIFTFLGSNLGIVCLVGKPGIEPRTRCLRGRPLASLSYFPIILVPETGLEPARPKAGDFKSPMCYQFHHSGVVFGTGGGIRTHKNMDFESISCTGFTLVTPALFGTLGRIRTDTVWLLRPLPATNWATRALIRILRLLLRNQLQYSL